MSFFRAASRLAARGVARARYAGRPAADPRLRRRYLAAAGSALSVTWRGAGGSLRRLWLEVAGVFFLAFAIIGAGAGWREYQAWQAGAHNQASLWLAAAFVLLFLWFGATSIARAHRK